MSLLRDSEINVGALDLGDIQHFLMARPPALAARYEFLTFDSPSCGRSWLKGLIEKVGTAKAVGSSPLDSRWLTIGFTSDGLRALGLPEASLMTFPEEFRQGMAARADILGMNGANHPNLWAGGLASGDLHAIAVLFARDVPERERGRLEHERYLGNCEGVKLLSSLDLEATPPFDHAHEHFGYRDRLSQPVIEGMVGLGLTIPEIIAPLRNVKLVVFALIANFVLMPLAAVLIARMLRLDQPLGEALLLLGVAAGAPFLPKLAGVAKSNLAFAVGLMVLLMVLTVGYMPLVLPLLLEGVSVDPLKIARSYRGKSSQPLDLFSDRSLWDGQIKRAVLRTNDRIAFIS